MVKGNFGGNWLDYWTLVLISEHITCKVMGYGEITFSVERFEHRDQIQGTWIEGVEQVSGDQERKMPGDGKVSGVIYWNVDCHLLHPKNQPISAEVPKVILAPWLAREASQYL